MLIFKCCINLSVFPIAKIVNFVKQNIFTYGKIFMENITLHQWYYMKSCACTLPSFPYLAEGSTQSAILHFKIASYTPLLTQDFKPHFESGLQFSLGGGSAKHSLLAESANYSLCKITSH